MEIKITDAMDGLQDDSVSIESKDIASASRIKELTMEKIKQARNSRPRRPLIRAALIAALIAMLALSSVAVYYGEGGWFLEFFTERSEEELTDSQIDVIDENVVRLDQSVTSNGYTITLESVISDSSVAYLKLNITAPEDVVLGDGYYYFDEFYGPTTQALEEQVSPVSVSGSGYSQVEDPDPTDNQISLLMDFTVVQTDDSFTINDGAVYYLELGRLCRAESVQGKIEDKITVIAEGEWDFEFSFGGGTQDQEVEVLTAPVTVSGETLDGEPVTVTVTSFRIRSMSAIFRYEFADQTQVECLFFDGMKIVMKDNTVIQPRLGGSSVDGDHEVVQMVQFSAPVSVEQIDYIEFPDGIILPVQLTDQE